MLLAAAAAGTVTGLFALVGTPVTTVAHGIGGLVALALVAVVASRARRRPMGLLLVAMVVANLTGVAWTIGGGQAVVLAHILTGVLASAGAVILASP